MDIAGNALAGVMSFVFTTGDFTAPTILYTIPACGATNVSTAAGTLVIVFSEPIDLDPLAQMPEYNLPVGTQEPQWSTDNTTVTFHYAALNESTLYYLELTIVGITDLAENELVDDANITFTTGDLTDPVADAGADQNVTAGTIVTFDSTTSTDNVGITNYTWTFTDGTPITLYGVGPTYQFNNAGLYLVTLNVSDAAGNWHMDTMTVTVTVTAAPPVEDTTAPVADAGADQYVNEGTLVVFDGSASTDNVGVVNWTWTFTDIVAVTRYGETPVYSFENPGVYTVTLNTTDAAGNWDTDTMTVTVLDITHPVADAGSDQTVDEGNLVTFDGSTSTDNIGIANWTWTFDDGSGIVTLYGVAPTHTFPNAGNFTVTLTVRDAANSTNTTTMLVTVRPKGIGPADGEGPPTNKFPMDALTMILILAGAVVVIVLVLLLVRGQRRGGKKNGANAPTEMEKYAAPDEKWMGDEAIEEASVDTNKSEFDAIHESEDEGDERVDEDEKKGEGDALPMAAAETDRSEKEWMFDNDIEDEGTLDEGRGKEVADGKWGSEGSSKPKRDRSPEIEANLELDLDLDAFEQELDRELGMTEAGIMELDKGMEREEHAAEEESVFAKTKKPNEEDVEFVLDIEMDEDLEGM